MNMSSEEVAPEVFNLKSDTLGLRCFEVTYKVGDSVPMHKFPENVFYVIEPGTIEYTLEDGKKIISEFKKGQAYIKPAGCAISMFPQGVRTPLGNIKLFHLLTQFRSLSASVCTLSTTFHCWIFVTFRSTSVAYFSACCTKLFCIVAIQCH
jgi:hypothetical protein